jgi:hypothetical protein
MLHVLGTRETHTEFWGQNVKERDSVLVRSECRKYTKYKNIEIGLKKLMFVCVEWIYLAQDEGVLGCCEHGNET